MKIYKSRSFVGGWCQFSFVSREDSYYYYLCYDDDLGKWIFDNTRALGIDWRRSGPRGGSAETSWLEVLVVSGFSEEEVLKRVSKFEGGPIEWDYPPEWSERHD